jgi:nitroimidazol reductase NimA-like FMN-containing flavoprotein (pyridoxamine 5'-phosphate oxidase superfamily)
MRALTWIKASLEESSILKRELRPTGTINGPIGCVQDVRPSLLGGGCLTVFLRRKHDGEKFVLIHDMTREMNIELLKSVHFGHIACVKDDQPYVTPFIFAYQEPFIYSFATIGRKISWMRANPLVCIEVEKIVTREEWQTVVALGRYEELLDTAKFRKESEMAHDLLAKIGTWWEPSYVRTVTRDGERPLEPIWFRILIHEMSGHRGIPDYVTAR